MGFKPILWRALKTIFIIAFIFDLYLGSILAIETIPNLYEKDINGISDLKNTLNEEQIKLGMCQDYNIHLRIIDENEASYSMKICEDEYEIGLHQTSDCSVIKHELYHILSGHCNAQSGTFSPKYLFSQKPKAAVYSLTGLRL